MTDLINILLNFSAAFAWVIGIISTILFFLVHWRHMVRTNRPMNDLWIQTQLHRIVLVMIISWCWAYAVWNVA